MLRSTAISTFPSPLEGEGRGSSPSAPTELFQIQGYSHATGSDRLSRGSELEHGEPWFASTAPGRQPRHQMGNSAWTSVAARLFVFSVLPVLLATLHVRLDAGARGRLRTIEVYLIYLFLVGVAAGGLSGFFGHVLTADTVAESIGWPKDNPFQQEMGFANLTLGVLGLIAAARRDGFREATVIAVSIMGVGATVVHAVDMLGEGNLAPGNSIQNVGNLLKPALLIPLLIVSRRSEQDGAATLSFDRWRETVVGTAGIVTAVVATALGIGFSLELAVPTALIGAALAAVIVGRRASLPTK
jgi:hypothetical protein